MSAPVAFDAIDEERRRRGLSIADVARRAGITDRTYANYRAGARTLRPATARALWRALQMAGAPSETGPDEHTRRHYRLVLALLAERHGVALPDVERHDPARRATNDPDWMRAARLRRLAVYLCNTAFALPQAELARVTGLSPAAVSLACADIEQERDEPATERMLDDLTTLLIGR